MPTIPSEDVQFKGQTYKTTQVSCSGCHDESYGSILDSWKDDLNTSLKKIAAKLAEADKLLAAKKHNAGDGNLFNEAKYNYYFVKDAKGVHNIDYAQALLKKAEEDLDRINSTLK